MGKGPKKEAEGGGFEPPVPIRVRQFSKLVVSATHPSFQMGLNDYEYPLAIGVQMYIKFCFLQIFYAQNLHFTQFSTSSSHSHHYHKIRTKKQPQSALPGTVFSFRTKKQYRPSIMSKKQQHSSSNCF